MKLEIKKFPKGYAIYAGVSRLSKFFKSEEEAESELSGNEKMYNYYAGSISVSVDNSPKTIIDANTGKSKKVAPYLDKQGRIMHEGMKLAERIIGNLSKPDKEGIEYLVEDNSGTMVIFNDRLLSLLEELIKDTHRTVKKVKSVELGKPSFNKNYNSIDYKESKVIAEGDNAKKTGMQIKEITLYLDISFILEVDDKGKIQLKLNLRQG